MSGVPTLLRPLARYADFKGRSSRTEFWSFMLVVYIVFGGLYAWIITSLLPLFQEEALTLPTEQIHSLVVPSLALWLLGLALLIPNLAVQVRRLHDSNRTGWWLLLPTATSMISQTVIYVFQGGELVAASLEMQEKMDALVAAGNFSLPAFLQANWPVYCLILPWTLGPALLSYLVLLIFFLWPGTPGKNRFGANPRKA